MLGKRGASARIPCVLAVSGAVVGFALLGGGRAAALGPPLPLPIPTPTISLPIPTLPLPTPSLPTLPVPTLHLPTPSVPALGPPTPIGAVPGGVPGSPGAAGAPGSPLPFQPPGSPWVPGGPAAGSSSGVSAGQSLVDTSVLGDLLALLSTPASVGVEQPSLQHFDVQTALAAGKLAAANSTRKPGAAGSPAFVWALGVACALALISLAMARQHRRRFSRLRAVTAIPLIGLAALLTVVSAQGTWFTATPVGSSTTLAVASAAHSAPSLPGAPSQTAGSVLYDRVVGFEAQIAASQVALSSPSTGQGAALLRQERALATSLETTLQQEYDFFAAVARDPAQAAALLQAAAAKPAPIRAAITYDVDAVQSQLAQQAVIAQAARNNSATNPAVGSGAPSVPSAAHAAPLMWPMSGVITQGFGPSQIAIEPAVTLAGITYPHFHTGVDIASAYGTPVQSAADGVVALAGAETDGFGHLVGYGNYVVVAHGGDMVTLYGHLAQVLVGPGQAVHAGDPIGLEGSSGNSTGPHVHFELRLHGTPTDPTSYVQPR